MNWNYYRLNVKNLITSVLVFIRWGLIAAVIGAAGGFLGVLLHYGVHYADEMVLEHGFLLYLLPLTGLAIVAVYKGLKTQGLSTDTTFRAVQESGEITIRQIPAVLIGTVLTHLTGGSSGKEGAALQIGGAAGNKIAMWLHLNEDDRRFATMAGMAALFAAVFGLPVTATIFVTMVISVGTYWYSAVYPALAASLVADAIGERFGIESMRFSIPVPEVGLAMMLKVAVLALLCAMISTLMCDVIHEAHRQLKRFIPNDWLRIAITAVVIVVLMKLTGTTRYYGSGDQLIRAAFTGEGIFWYDFLLKMLLTALTLGAGFQGGEVMPSFAIGASFGYIAAPLLGIDPALGAAIGLVSVFGGASNSLIAPILLSIEIFGAGGLNYFAMAAIASYIMSGYTGFYYSQQILYSKLHPERIEIHANEEHEEVR